MLVRKSAWSVTPARQRGACRRHHTGGGSRGRPHVQGTSEGTGVMQGVRRVVDGGIPDESSDDSTWEGDGYTTAMEHLGRGGWASDFQNDFLSEGRPAELPGGGMPGPSVDKGGNVGAITAPACTQHRGHSGGGKSPPPTVRPMQHAGPPVGPERQASVHGPMCQGSGEKEAAAHRGGDEGELGAGLRGIKGTDTE